MYPTAHNLGMGDQAEKQAAYAEALAPRVREAIDGCNKTQAEVARQMGVSRSAVWQWMHTGQVDNYRLVELAEVTGVDVRWLMTGKGDRSSEAADIAQRISRLTPERRRQIRAFTDALGMPPVDGSGAERDPDEDDT